MKTCSPTNFPSPQKDIFLSYMSQIKKRSARGCSGIFNVNFEILDKQIFPVHITIYFSQLYAQVKKRSARGCSGVFNVNFEYT